MTYGACTPDDFMRFDRASRSRRPDTLTMLCAATLAVSATVGLWALYAPMHGTAAIEAPQVTVELAPAPAAIAPLRYYAGLLDPAFSGGAAPLTFAQSAPLRAHFEPARREAEAGASRSVDPQGAQVATLEAHDGDATDVEPQGTEMRDLAAAEPQVVPPAPKVSKLVDDVPLPTPRPRMDLPGYDGTPPAPPQRRVARVDAAAPAPAVTPSAPATPGLFDKLFGSAKPATPAQPPSAAVLAYAAPQEGLIGNLFGGRPAATAPDAQTAIYDISAHTVYMPDGTRLEAHSGLGDAFDNPNGVHLRMRGATPPNLYDLSPREALFHGVRALRLTPIGNGQTYGRGGLLAHTFMLRGGTGESNGCVVFRDYAAFLRAYDNGQIKRLSVVARRI